MSIDLAVCLARVVEVVADLEGPGVIHHVLQKSCSVLLWLDLYGEGMSGGFSLGGVLLHWQVPPEARADCCSLSHRVSLLAM